MKLSDDISRQCRLRWTTAALLAAVLPVAASPCAAQDEEIDQIRSGLVYSIGRVEDVSRGSAVIDLGDAHNLSNVPPLNRVAVFRVTSSRYVPVGALTISESYDTYSRTAASPTTKPVIGDIVMFVRELSQLESVANHRDNFIRQQIVKTANQSEYSTMRRFAVARTLRNYARDHRKWVKNGSIVVGFLNGESFAEGREKRIKPLLDYIGLMREDYRAGRNSLSAAGKEWNAAVKVLVGPTAETQHDAAQPVVDENIGPPETMRPPDRDIRRLIRDRFFDRSAEQQNLLSYLLATLLEHSPRNQDVWFRQQILMSQFPELADEEYVLEQIRDLLRDIQEGL